MWQQVCNVNLRDLYFQSVAACICYLNLISVVMINTIWWCYLSVDAKPDIVVTTRVPVAGSYDRSISAQELADSWIHAAQSCAFEVYSKQEDLQVHPASGKSNMNMHFADEKKGQESRGLLLVLRFESLDSAIREAAVALKQRCKEDGMQSVICVTGSLHAVAGALLLIQKQHN